MSTGNWISVNLNSKLAPKTILDRGVLVSVQASPHDVPKAVRGGWDPAIQRFVIEFRYLDNETYVKERGDENLTLRIGKNSHRLLGLELDLKSLRASTVALEFTHALRDKAMREIENVVQRRENSGSSDSVNYEFARMALERSVSGAER